MVNDDFNGEHLLQRDNFSTLEVAIQKSETECSKQLRVGYLLKTAGKAMKAIYFSEGKDKDVH